jgi:peptidoglycan/xylan/chitin deacetylase (PgdA/CDA1 family)
MRCALIGFALLLAASAPAWPEACPGHADAIGTARTLTVDPHVLPQIGTMQYSTSLPLDDHEVVLTFDDGPLPPYTNRILEILAENCVKVDYFLVGEMANAYPHVVRQIYNAGHVIGTHSLHHPLIFNRMDEAQLASEVEGGIVAVDAALGDPRAVAPFFRIPGLLRSNETDSYLASKSLAVFSADEVADDWRHGITPKKIVALAMKRLDAKGHRGVLLLHDIHPATVLALPALLKELKDNGYKIVQAVPPGDRPASVPEKAPVPTASGGPSRTVAAPAASDASAKRMAHHHHRAKKHVRLHRFKQAASRRKLAKNLQSRI